MDRSFLQPGAVVDTYKIVRLVGAGGFGVTYEAEDMSLGKTVALKEYYPEEFSVRTQEAQIRPTSERHARTFEWGRSSFMQEARMLAKFRHPNIVQVHRVFEANATAYMIMDFERGPSVEKWLASLERTPTQDEIDQLVGPLLDALALMHAKDFLHRDIAPDNIIIRPDGRPVLLDFGSARNAVAAKTQVLTGLVKQGFSPQEQYATDGKFQGPWSDFYALGATLYWLVSGQRPDEATNRILHDTLASAVDVARGPYRPAFLRGIDCCLKLRPAERPQTVAEVRTMLMDGKRSIPRSAPAALVTAPPLPEAAPAPSVARTVVLASLARMPMLAKAPGSGLGGWRKGAFAAALVTCAVLGPVVGYKVASGKPAPRAITTSSAALEKSAALQRVARAAAVPALPWSSSAVEMEGWRLKQVMRLGGGLSRVAISHDRTTVATAAQREGTVTVLEAATLKLRSKLKLENYTTANLHGIALLPDNARVAVLRTGVLETYDLETRARVGAVELPKGHDSGDLGISRDGKRLYVLSSATEKQTSVVSIYAIAPSALRLLSSVDFSVRVDSLDIAADDRHFLVGTYPNNTLALFDAQERRFVWSRACSCSALFAANDNLIVFAGRYGAAAGDFGKNSSIGLMDVDNPDRMDIFHTSTTETLSVTDISPDSRYAAIGATTIGQVFIMPVSFIDQRGKLKPVTVLKDNSGQSIAGAVFAGRDSLVTGSGDNNVRLWKR